MIFQYSVLWNHWEIRTTIETINDEKKRLETESYEGKVSDPFHAISHLGSFDEESWEEEEEEEDGAGDDHGDAERLDAEDSDEETESLGNEAAEECDAEEVAKPPCHFIKEAINPNLLTVPVEEVGVAEREDQLEWDLRNCLRNVVAQGCVPPIPMLVQEQLWEVKDIQ